LIRVFLAPRNVGTNSRATDTLTLHENTRAVPVISFGKEPVRHLIQIIE